MKTERKNMTGEIENIYLKKKKRKNKKQYFAKEKQGMNYKIKEENIMKTGGKTIKKKNEDPNKKVKLEQVQKKKK